MTPDEARPILDDAEATLQTGDARRAEALFRTILSAEGPSATQKGQAEAGLGEAALLSNRAAEAADHFHKAAHLDPASSAWLHYRMGEAHMKAGMWEEALVAFRDALARYPEDERHARAEVRGRLGRARVLSGDKAGERDLLQAIDEDPLHASLHADLGDCLLGRRAWAEAAEAYARALELEPGNPDYAAARTRALAIAEKLAKGQPPP